jgi:hypothetical protein
MQLLCTFDCQILMSFNSELFFSETALQYNDEVCFGFHFLPTGDKNAKFERKMMCY